MRGARVAASGVVGALLAALLGAVLSGVAAAGAARTIKIGVIDPYTGPAAPFAEYALQGFKLAVDEANRSGVLGATLSYVTRDTEFRPDVAVQRARELILRERVQILVGTTNSAASLAVSRLAREHRVPFFVWIAQSERITGAEGHRYVFQTIPNTAMSGRAGAVQMARLPHTRYWIAGSDYEYGHAIATSFWTYLKQFRPDVQKVGETWWPVGERDFAPYLTAIAAARPEALVLAVGGADITGSAKALSTAGLHRQMAVWIHTITDRATLEPLGDEAPIGVYGTNGYYHYYPATPENQEFARRFLQAYGRYPNGFAFSGYVTGRFIVEGFRKAGSFDTEAFIDAVEGLTIASPIGPVTLRAYDHLIVQPVFFGTTTRSPDYPYPVAGDIVELSGSEVVPPVEDIRQARQR